MCIQIGEHNMKDDVDEIVPSGDSFIVEMADFCQHIN